MAAWKCRTLLRLHQAPRWIPVIVFRGPHGDIATTFLHDDAQYYARFDTDVLGGILNSVEEVANIFVAVSSQEHGWLVDVEQSVEVFPRRLGRECGGWARE